MSQDPGTLIELASRVRKLPPSHVKRDELISMMLQERNVLRLLSAPYGFGKTALATEYASRLFAEQDVMLFDVSSPDFLLALDDEALPALHEDASRAALVILDGMPWLHEHRAIHLSQWIDELLYNDVEVIVTTRPSCDCLSALQPGRMLVRSTDLLATEKECAPSGLEDQDGDARAFGRKRWSEASALLFGRVPAMLWGAAGDAQAECLEGLFSEELPLSLVHSMVALLLFESGNLRELERAGLKLHADDITMLSYDYPVFGVDSVSGDFKVAKFDLADLRHAILANKLEPFVFEGTFSLPSRIVSALFKRGDHRRGSAVIDAFCNDEQCAAWLEEHGWDLLDSGELSLVSGLLDRCPEETYAKSAPLRALHAWLSGLSGDGRESCHLSAQMLQASEDVPVPDLSSVAARLALAGFDENAILSTTAYKLSSDDSPQKAIDFLAMVIDLCTNAEVVRAFSLDSLEGDLRFEKTRRFAGKQRVRQLRKVFTEYSGAFGDSRCFLLALHLLAHVESPDLRSLVQDLGCDAILRMRRRGVSRFSEALVVRDMWEIGYFGMVGPVVDRRDAKVLDAAAHMLTMLYTYSGRDAADIPWETQGAPHAARGDQGQLKLNASGAEEMYVRLFGGFEITIGDRHLTEGKWRKKARALFAMLVLNNGRDVPRDDIFAQLWPTISRTHAMDNFYTIWSNCVSAIGESPYLERNGEFCRIDPRFVRSDVAEFEQLTRHLLTSDHDSKYLLDTYAKIEVLYRGPLMPSERNVKTINALRERYRALYVDAMVAATECALRVNDTRIALWFARKAAEEDQTREDVYRVLMKAQIAAGQRCPAIRSYLACREYLQSTLGLDPSIETRELYDSLITTDPELLRLEATLSASSLLSSG